MNQSPIQTNTSRRVDCPLLEMKGISKRFGKVRASDQVNLQLYPREILGLLGENGAGKTTLMNILFGVYRADQGEIFISGQKVKITSSADALVHGVGMVHQHFHLVPRHSVLENLMVGQKGWHLDREMVINQMKKIASLYGISLDPDTRVCDLTVGQQQRVEILKALVRGARILILDEPTATLTPDEAKGLFSALRAMAEKGMGVIFISHKLHEIIALTHRVQILCEGRVAATVVNDENTRKKDLATLMCGREIIPPVKPPGKTGRVLLEMENIYTLSNARVSLKGVSLTLRAGEVLGIAGVSGNGQSEVADIIAGVLSPSSGRLKIADQPVKPGDPREIQALGIGRIPEDRMGTGLITTLPLETSMVLSRINEKQFNFFGFLRKKAIRTFVRLQMKKFGIKAAGPGVRTGTLSGGNLQKVLLARELAWDPVVVMAAQPTRGLDVAAARFVHQQFLDLRADGRGVVVISEDLEELFLLSDRIAVMYEGRIMDTFPIAEATVERVGLLMAGVREAA